MQLTFYISALVAILSTIMVITRFNIIHALLYLVVSFLALATVFFILGAPFAAALEIIIYAGAIVVLIIFVIMMLNLKGEAIEQEKRWLTPAVWIGPAILSFILLGELVYVLVAGQSGSSVVQMVDAKAVGRALYGQYILAVELSGMLLMAGIVGAYHLGKTKEKSDSSVLRTNRRMNEVQTMHGLLLAGILFMLGLIGVLIRRNILYMLVSVEIMLNSAGLAFIVAGSKWAQPDGQVMFIFILTMAAAEVSVGLALILQIHHQLKTLDSDAANEMKG